MYQYTMQMTGDFIDCASALTLDELSVARTGAAADDVGAMAKMSSLPLLLEHLRLDALKFLWHPPSLVATLVYVGFAL